MTIDPYKNMLLHAGVRYNYSGDPRLGRLQGDGRQAAIQARADEDEKIAAQKYRLNEFASDADKFLDRLKGESISIRADVAKALKQRITVRQSKEDNKFNFITKFFHRVWHLFHGHGFTTTAEYAQKVLKKLESSGEIKNFREFKSGLHWDFKKLADPTNQERIRSVPPKKIEQLYKKGDFKEIFNGMVDETGSYGWRYLVQNVFTPEQRRAFFAAILESGECFTRVFLENLNNYNSIMHSIPNAEAMEHRDVIREILGSFDYDQLVRVYKEYRSKNTARSDIDERIANGHEFFQGLAELVIQKNIANNQWTKLLDDIKELKLGTMAMRILNGQPPLSQQPFNFREQQPYNDKAFIFLTEDNVRTLRANVQSFAWLEG